MRAHWAVTDEALERIGNIDSAEAKLYLISQLFHFSDCKLAFERDEQDNVSYLMIEIPNCWEHDETISFDEYKEMVMNFHLAAIQQSVNSC